MGAIAAVKIAHRHHDTLFQDRTERKLALIWQDLLLARKEESRRLGGSASI
jgi:hypothetical protein